MKRFGKRIMRKGRHLARNFSGHFNKYFVKNMRKKGPTGKHFRFFLLDTLKATL